MKWAGDEKLKEPTEADLRQQAERLAKTFAMSLHERSVATFYFILGHYVEQQTQFGIIRRDLTPRPAYVALAAAGRLLADAQPLGRLKTEAAVQAYAFRARPDGAARDVLVAWSRNGQATFELAAAPQALFDHLGRAVPAAGTTLRLTTAATFAVLPAGTAWELQPPPDAPPRLAGQASPVVLQVLVPEEQTVLAQSARRISSERAESLAIVAYNFGEVAARGKLRVEAPQGWQVALDHEELELPPRERRELTLRVDCSQAPKRQLETLRIRGDFAAAGEPVLSFRLMP